VELADQRLGAAFWLVKNPPPRSPGGTLEGGGLGYGLQAEQQA